MVVCTASHEARRKRGFSMVSVSSRRVESGFTLIELLVVIAIISILASILMPAFAQAREKGRQTVCLSNTKQLDSAFMMYAQDYDEGYPGSAYANGAPLCSNDPALAGNWVLQQTITDDTYRCVKEGQPVRNGSLFAYVKDERVYTCLSDAHNDTKTLSYGMNAFLSGSSLAATDSPSKTILLVDEGDTLNDGNFTPPTTGTISGTGTGQASVGTIWTDKPTVRHNGGGIVSFADGHAKWRKMEMMTPNDFSLNPQ